MIRVHAAAARNLRSAVSSPELGTSPEGGDSPADLPPSSIQEPISPSRFIEAIMGVPGYVAFPRENVGFPDLENGWFLGANRYFLLGIDSAY